MEEKKSESVPASLPRRKRAARIAAVALAACVLVGFIVLAQRRAADGTERDKYFASSKDARMVGLSGQQYLMEQPITLDEARRLGLPGANDQYSFEATNPKPGADEINSSAKSGAVVPTKKKTEPMRKKNK